MKFSFKTTILIVIVLAAVIGGYFYLEGTKPPPPTGLQSAGTEAVNSSIISLLNEIKSLRVDSTLFETAAYKSLVDYSVPIPQENVGRDNPFAPIPGVSTTPSPNR